MSETLPAQETPYPPFSEASENDNRDELAAALDNTPEETPQASPQPAETSAEETTEETAEPSEDETQARAARLARDLREQRRRARQLEQENLALRGQRTETRDEQIEREIQQRAAQMAAADRVNKAANDVYNEGVKQFGRQEFDSAVQAMNESFGQQTSLVIETLVDLPNAEKVIQHLSLNPDVMDDLASLPPHRLGAALAKEAAKLAPKPKAVSKAPKPITPISTANAAEPEVDMEHMSMEQLAKMWDRRDFMKRFG